MSTLETSQAIVEIRKALQARTDKDITGALLGELIRRVVPDFRLRDLANAEIGTITQKVFVSRFLNDTLSQIGHKGKDILYSIDSQSMPAQNVDTALISSTIWDTFVRPDSANVLTLDASKSNIFICDRATRNDSITTIESVQNSDFDAMRTEFIAALPSAEQSQMEKNVVNMNIYAVWIEALKRINRTQYHRWSEFRRAAIVSVFKKRLLEANVPEANRLTLEKMLLASQEASRRQKELEKAKYERAGTPKTSITSSDLANYPGFSNTTFRTIVLSALNKMNNEELRHLNMPVGLLLDSVYEIMGRSR